MIKCSLIDITTDNRAVICVGEGEKGEVKTTARVSWVDYGNEKFSVGKRIYDFQVSHRN